jgi:hypothetical protein
MNMPITPAPPLPVVPPDVLALAAEKGVAEYLPAVLELLPRTFPNARRFAVSVDEDPEIANERNIIFDVDLPVIDGPEFLAVQRQWNDGLFAIVPAPLICGFRLSMNLQE